MHLPGARDVVAQCPNAQVADVRGTMRTHDLQLMRTRARYRGTLERLGYISAWVFTSGARRPYVPLMKYSLAPSLALTSCSCTMNAPSGGKTSFESPFGNEGSVRQSVGGKIPVDAHE